MAEMVGMVCLYSFKFSLPSPFRKTMFEITGDDISLLNDEQLRAVVARLCEAELRKRGFSPAHVTWGGN